MNLSLIKISSMPKLKNPKHELLARNIIKQKFNLTKAYQETYPNSSYGGANSHVHDVVKRSEVKNRIQELAESVGYTPKHLIQTLQDATTALKSIFHEGKHVIDVPDWSSRIESAKTGLKLYGFVGADNQTNIDARSVSVSLDPNDIARLSATVKELASMRRSLANKTSSVDSPVQSIGQSSTDINNSDTRQKSESGDG